MAAIVTDEVLWSVCLLVTFSATMAEPLEMPFGGRVGWAEGTMGCTSPYGKRRLLMDVCSIAKPEESLFIAPMRICGRILTIRPPFGVALTLLSILGVKYPQNPDFGGSNKHFKHDARNIKICVLWKLLHRILHSA